MSAIARTSITPRAAAAQGGAGQPASSAWAHVWFTGQPQSWSTLAVVPAAPGFRAIAAADALTTAGRTYGEADIALIDATSVTPDRITEIIETGARRAAQGVKTVIATASPIDDPGAIAIARRADCVLLAVPLGDATIARARATIALIGREHFLGAVVIDQRGQPRTEL